MSEPGKGMLSGLGYDDSWRYDLKGRTLLGCNSDMSTHNVPTTRYCVIWLHKGQRYPSGLRLSNCERWGTESDGSRIVPSR